MDEVEAEILRDKIAARRAELDQLEEMLWRQYPMRHPRFNKVRLETRDAAKFSLELDQWNVDAYFEQQGEL